MTEEAAMITLTKPDEPHGDFEGKAVTAYLATLANADDISFTSTKGKAYFEDIVGDESSNFYNVYFKGTDLDAPDGGTITEMSFSYSSESSDPGDGIYVSKATGVNLNSADLLAATHAAQNGDTSELKALFKGLDWTLKAPADSEFFFGGTGGDDVVSLSSANDKLQLDGGNDNIRLGAGDDTINLDNYFGYQAPGLSHIDAGAGFDILDLSTDQANAELKHGLDIHLDGTTDMGAFSIQLKNAEEVLGTKFADTITGTDGDDLIYGGAGNDKLMGGRGADYLIGGGYGRSYSDLDDDRRDTFIFKDVDDSPAGNGHDTIVMGRADIIDLTLIDAGTKSGRFHIVDSGPLEHVGDLRIVYHDESVPALTYITLEANLDHDEAPEFEIEVHGALNMDGHHLFR
jgi:Ca2+-binding RTX toxin-like protein